MTTRDTMRDEMASLLKRTTINTEIEESIAHAIAEMQTDGFFFNETHSATFVTVVNQIYYDEDDDADIPLMNEFEAIHIRISNSDISLKRIPSIDMFESLHDGASTSGQPTRFIYHDKQIGLYPKPNDVYTVTMIGGYDEAAPATGNEADNPWMTDGYLMTMYKAMEWINRARIHNFDLADQYLGMFTREQNRLFKRTAKLKKTNRIKPTQF